MSKISWWDLQLFAEGTGDGGGEAAPAESGESAGDAAQQRLLELNVPEDKVKRWAKHKEARDKRNGVRTPEPQPAATAETEEPKKPEQTKASWDELMKDPDYNKAMQDTVQSRLKTAKKAEETLNSLAQLLAKKYGIDATNGLDMEAITKAVTDDANQEADEDAAMEMGVNVDTYRRIREMQQQEQETVQDKRLREHAERVVREAQEMEKKYPGFDLMKERANNEVFRRMVDNPDNPIPLEVAYKAVHHDEIVNSISQAAIRSATEKVTNSIASNRNRPAEAGTNGRASSVTTFDYSKASKAERDALKARIRAAAARGEKIYPGQ